MSLDAENVSGQGGGSNLVYRNLRSSAFGDFPSYNTTDRPARSSADWLHMDGLLLCYPYDLTAMGTWGTNISTAKGFRYVWFIAPDHDSEYAWGLDAEMIYRGFSNDPTILPDPSTLVPIVSVLGTTQTGTAASFTASIAGDGVTLNVSGISSGIIALGYQIAGTGITGSPHIVSMGTGMGGTGTYVLSVNQGGAIGSEGMTATVTGSGLFNGHFFPWFVFNADTNQGHLYLQCIVTSGINDNAWNEGCWTTTDIDNYTFQGIAFTNSLNPGFGFASGMTVYRLGVNNWIAFGSADTGSNDGKKGYWTSTDGLRFTFQGQITGKVGSSVYTIQGAPKFTVGGQDYVLTWEDARGNAWSSSTTYAIGDRANIITYSGPRNEHYYEFQTYQSLTNGNLNNNPSTSPANWVTVTDGGQFLAQVVIDSHGNVLASPAPVRQSAMYTGTFPGPTYVSYVSGIMESGFCVALVLHGFYPALNPATLPAPYIQGGGLSEEYLDVYPVIVDATAAPNAAPFGVRCSCAGGNILIRWFDISPGHNYRVKRATSLGGTYANLADVTVGQYIDTTGTLGTVYYYKVVTLNGGVEKDSRTVSTYCGQYDSFTCAHVTRALAAGADATTISEWRIAKVVRWLIEHDKLKHLRVGTAAWMGVVQDGSHNISRIFDLGTTLLPRMGDLTPTTATGTTYSATAINSVTPGWINANNNSFGMYGNFGKGTGSQGRLNNIRKWDACTFFASYQKSNANQTTFVSTGEFNSGLTLRVAAGSPGTPQFLMADKVTSHTATGPALSGATPHIIAGTYDGNGTAKCYTEGVAGTPVTGIADNSVLLGQTGVAVLNFFLGTGTTSLKFGANSSPPGPGGTYVFENNEAQYNGHANFGFDVLFTDPEIASFTQLLRDDTTATIVDDIKATYGAKGDGQKLLSTWTTSGMTLTCNGTSPFVSGDTGKYFALSGAGTAGGILSGTLTFVSSTQVTMSVSAITPLTSSSQTLEWGTNDSATFAAFNTARAGSTSPVELDIPAGRYCFMGAGLGIGFTWNVKNLRVVGSGTAVFTDMSGTGRGWFLGGCAGGQSNNNTSQARTSTANAGSSMITLKNSSDASRFSPPCWALMTGLDIQGFGYPSNQQFYEWVYVTSIVGAAVNLQSPLVNTYKDTWPVFNAGNASNVDCGGPATLYAIEAGWDCDHEYVNIQQESTGQINSIGRNVTYTGGGSIAGNSAGCCVYPSRNKVWTCNGVDTTAGSSEIDKLIANVVVNGGHWSRPKTQSPSPDSMTFENVVMNSNMLGSPKNTSLKGCYLNGGASFGPTAFGYGTSVYSEACSFANVGASSGFIGGVAESDVLGAGAYQFIGGGIIKRLKSGGSGSPPQWGTSNGICFIGTNSLTTEYIFQVTDIYEDGTYIYIRTTLDGFPTIPGPTWNIHTHPCPQLTMVACVGCVDAIDMSGAPTARAPIYSYTKRTFSNWAAQQQSTSWIWGRLVSYTLGGYPGDTPYTGVLGTLKLEPAAQLGAACVSPTGGASIFYDPVLNMIVGGQRILLPGSVSAQSGDVLGAAPGALWFTKSVSPFLDSSISGESSSVWPTITIELVTDQTVIQVPYQTNLPSSQRGFFRHVV
jgi:hypothetical protein